MGSMNDDEDSAQAPIPLKYATVGDIDTEDFLAAARKAGGATRTARVHEIAWHLSDYGVPEKLRPAPDVSEFAVKRKAEALARLGLITHMKDTLYLIPTADEG